MTNFRAICTDIDGTLLNADRQLSPRTISTIRTLAADSITVILASSRMPAAMTHLQEELSITNHPLISYNGGFTQYFNGTQWEIITDVTIPFEICDRAMGMIGDTVHMSIYFRDQWYAPAMDVWTEREERITKVKSTIQPLVVTMDRMRVTDQGAHKLMCMGTEDQIDRIETSLGEVLSEALHLYRSRPTYLEIAPKAVTKATGLEKLCGRLAISMEEVLAFGDNYNDVEMLRQVGLGVAVENGNDAARSSAKQVCGKSIDDGVARFIERQFPSKFGPEPVV